MKPVGSKSSNRSVLEPTRNRVALNAACLCSFIPLPSLSLHHLTFLLHNFFCIQHASIQHPLSNNQTKSQVHRETSTIPALSMEVELGSVKPAQRSSMYHERCTDLCFSHLLLLLQTIDELRLHTSTQVSTTSKRMLELDRL